MSGNLVPDLPVASVVAPLLRVEIHKFLAMLRPEKPLFQYPLLQVLVRVN